MSLTPEIAFELDYPPNPTHITGETALIRARQEALGNGIILSHYHGTKGPLVDIGAGIPFSRPDQMFAWATKMAEAGGIRLLSFSDRWPLEEYSGHENDLISFLGEFPQVLVWEVGTMGFFDHLAKTRFHKPVISRVDQFISVSKTIEREAIRNGVAPEKIITIMPPIDTAIFSPIEPTAKLRMRKNLSLPEAAPIGIYVGRFDEHKGIDFLLDAWNKTSSDPGYLLLLGSAANSEQSRYEELIRKSPRVIYRGFIQDIEMKALYFQAADYLTFPSRSEGLSLMMMEAMASGLPAIVNAEAVYKSGVGELFTEDVTGTSMQKLNPKELNRAIQTVLRNKEAMAVASRRELLRIATDLPTTATTFRLLYDKLIMRREGM